jgi:DNA-binding PadR family transcriptional regulator
MYVPEIEIKNVAKLFTVMLLSDSEQTGYTIMKALEGRLGRRASPGQIYPFLKQLKQYRYVECRRRGAREKQIYRLTPEGRRFVGRLSDRLDGLFEIAIRPKLTACAHCGCEIYKGGYKEKVGSKYVTFCCENCAKSYGTNK